MGNEDCVNAHHENGKWNDDSCNKESEFICEREPCHRSTDKCSHCKEGLFGDLCDHDSVGRKLCFVNTISTKAKDSKVCIFPFSFEGKTYFECTADHSANNAEWCATEVNSNGEVVLGQWEDCDRKPLTCVQLEQGDLLL